MGLDTTGTTHGIVSIRSFVPIYRPFMYLSEDNKSLLGPIGQIFNKVKKLYPCLNITYVPHEGSVAFFEVGKCIKGKCYGVIDMIRQEKSDFWILGAPLDAFDGQTDGFFYGPGVIEMSDMITTLTSASEADSVKLDLTTSLNSVGFDVYLTLSFILITFIMISKLSYLRQSQSNDQKSESVLKILWNVFNIGVTQSAFRADTFAQRILLISFTVGFFIIASHYHAHLNTNLVIKKTEKNIDTLTDLLNSDKQPIFLKYGPTTARFKSSTNPVYQQISKRSDYVTLNNLSSFHKMGLLIKSRRAAFVGPSIISSVQETVQCYIQSSQNVSHSLYYSKQQFNKIIWIFFYSARLKEAKRKELNLVGYMALEYGMYKYVAREVFNVIIYLVGFAATDDCKKKPTIVQTSRDSFIQLASLRNLLLFWQIGNVLGVLVFIMQLIFRIFFKRKVESYSTSSQKD